MERLVEGLEIGIGEERGRDERMKRGKKEETGRKGTERRNGETDEEIKGRRNLNKWIGDKRWRDM